MDSRRIVLRNAALLDPEAGSLAEGQAVAVEGGQVVEVAATPPSSTSAAGRSCPA